VVLVYSNSVLTWERGPREINYVTDNSSPSKNSEMSAWNVLLCVNATVPILFSAPQQLL
jgi:hypothetical protein